MGVNPEDWTLHDLYPDPLRTVMTNFFVSVSVTQVLFQDLDVPNPSRSSSSTTPRMIGGCGSYWLGMVYGGLSVMYGTACQVRGHGR